MITLEGTKSQVFVKKWKKAEENGNLYYLIYGVIDEADSHGDDDLALVEIDAVHQLWGHSGNCAGEVHRVSASELEDAKVARSMARRLVKLDLAVEATPNN